MKQGRNAPCACGSGKKTKHCCQPQVAVRPSVSPAELNQLVALFQAGRYAELEHQAHLLLEQFPESGLGWKLLCAALQTQGKDALHALQKAAEFLPKDVDALGNLGLALQDQGKLIEAARC